MSEISGVKRLAVGLSVMGLGLLGALPFRHDPAVSQEQQFVRRPALLGDGVALQVPGQTGVSATPATGQAAENWEQVLIAEEAAQRAEHEQQHEIADQLVEIHPPPQLPDRYQPLFPLEPNRRRGAGRVLSSSSAALTTSRPRVHTIHDGDTLASLARRYLDDPTRADEILQLNRSVLADPEVLPIGVQIVIPRREPVGGAETGSGLTPLPETAR